MMRSRMYSDLCRRTFLKAGAAAAGGVLTNMFRATRAMGSGNRHEAFFTQQDLFVSGNEGYHTFRIPAILVSRNGVILAFCEGRRDNQSDTGQIDLVLKRSADGGRTWAKLQTVVSESGMTCGNPAPVLDRRTGKIILLLTKNPADTPENDIIEGKGSGTRTVWVTESADDGASWAVPREITRDVKKPGWTWYATGPCHGIQLMNGTLVIPCDHVLGNNHDYSESAYSHLIVSDDGGKTWRLGGISQKGMNECAAVETVDGSIYLNSRAYLKTGVRHYSWSRDNGETLTDYGKADELIEPVCQASLIRFTEERFHRKNRILFSNPASTSRDHMRVRISYDECKTWSVSRLLHEGPAAYSDIAVLPDMSVLVFYERGKEHPYETISLAGFNLEWLTDNADHIELK